MEKALIKLSIPRKSKTGVWLQKDMPLSFMHNGRHLLVKKRKVLRDGV